MRKLGLGVVVALLAAPLPAAARTGAKPVVRVLHTGSSGRISGTAQYFSYGVVVRNASATKDAFGVKRFSRRHRRGRTSASSIETSSGQQMGSKRLDRIA